MRRPDPDQPPSSSPVLPVEPQALLLAVAHSVADAVVTADEHGRITMWTGGSEAIFGWGADEVLGRSITTLVPEQHREAHVAGLVRVAGDGERRVIGKGPVELTALRRDGTEFPAELTLATGHHDGQRFFAAVIRDVSARHAADAELQAALRELERSNAELQQFASVASHDLNEPLRIVDGYLGLLRRRYAGQLDETAEEFIGYAVDAVGRMQRLIDDLLRYARAGAGPAARTTVDLGAVAREALARIGASIDAAGAKVEIGDLPTVTGDGPLLRQVLQNLLANAVKFRREDVPSVVKVSSSRLEGAWEISVADNGIGVDDDAALRIFDMFGRGRGAGRDRAGSGIGLALCKRAIEAHGGIIRVVHVTDGGSEFRFTLPDDPDGRRGPVA